MGIIRQMGALRCGKLTRTISSSRWVFGLIGSAHMRTGEDAKLLSKPMILRQTFTHRRFSSWHD
jgi:hypothetical protein